MMDMNDPKVIEVGCKIQDMWVAMPLVTAMAESILKNGCDRTGLGLALLTTAVTTLKQEGDTEEFIVKMVHEVYRPPTEEERQAATQLAAKLAEKLKVAGAPKVG
jgi:hypothetical protein